MKIFRILMACALTLCLAFTFISCDDGIQLDGDIMDAVDFDDAQTDAPDGTQSGDDNAENTGDNSVNNSGNQNIANGGANTEGGFGALISPTPSN